MEVANIVQVRFLPAWSGLYERKEKMTVNSIETVQELIEEIQADGTMVGSAWEYINAMNNQKMFAVFTTHQFCDIHCSPTVKNPERIWACGKYIDKYEYLN